MHSLFLFDYLLIVLDNFWFRFSEPQKIKELQRKSLTMLNFFKNQSNNNLVHESRENINPSDKVEPENESLDEINKMIGLLGNLSMFYAYNANWGNQNFPALSKNYIKLFGETTKNGSLKPQPIGQYIFHLTMPYTLEVNRKYYSITM